MYKERNLGTTTLSKMTISIAIFIDDTQKRTLTIMLLVIMLSVVMLSGVFFIVLISVIMFTVIMFRVVAPKFVLHPSLNIN